MEEKYRECVNAHECKANIVAGGLQELNWFSGAWDTVKHDAGTAEHAVVHGFHEATPDLKWAAGEAWKGATACYANAECKAAVEKYGTKAVEAAMKKTQLQELNWFHHAWDHVKHDATKVEHAVVHEAHKAAPDLKKMAGLAWKGTKWCYADATCKANVEKYGLAATEAAFALQVIILI